MASVFVAGALAYEVGRTTPGNVEVEAVVGDQISLPRAENTVPPAAETWAFEPLPSRMHNQPIIALIIDDAGIDPLLTRRATDLGIPMTLSFLPYAEASADLARLARAQGHDVFLHLPMEPVGFSDPGPRALTRHLTSQEIASRTRLAFNSIPGAIGLNNHMGSAFTADEDAMRSALEALESRNLIFVDSLTSGRSRAREVANRLGYTSLSRDVFIDHDANSVQQALDHMANMARQSGPVIAIGHPRPGTLDALENWLMDPANQDIRFVTISDYVGLGAVSEAPMSNETVRLFSGAE
ncbi:divergent polysaccharide deacetylase family protein [Hyphobacterium sp.]|uniref:divergent polysaccharide deacetylase family protein n=1 Tax=Hyphobacterium sp. TaxID=2004662 RepID=UPI003BAC3C96